MDNKLTLSNEVRNESDIAVYMTGDDGTIGVWNTKAVGLFGYSVDEAVGKKENFLYHDPTEDINEGGVRYSWRTKKNHEIFFVEETVVEISDPENANTRFMKIVEDFSEHLSPSEKCELWMTQYANSTWGSMVVNSKTLNLEMINETCAQLFGYDPKEILGQSANMIMAPTTLNIRDSLIQKLDQSGQEQFVVECIRKDGSIFMAVSDCVVIPAGPETGAYYLCHIRLAETEMLKLPETAILSDLTPLANTAPPVGDVSN